MPDSDAVEDRSRTRRPSVTSAFVTRTDEPRLAAGTRLFLVSLGFVGAVVISAFAVASFSSLYTDGGVQTRSGVVDAGEVNSSRPDTSPSTVGNAASVKLDTTSSRADAPAPPAPQNPPPAEAPMPETGQSQPAGQPSLSSGGALQPKAEAEHNDATPAPPFSGEAAERLFRDFRSQQHQQVEPGSGTTASTPNTASSNARGGQSSEYRLETNTDVRKSRIRKECGPIKDPQLYRDCVATFQIQSRTR